MYWVEINDLRGWLVKAVLKSYPENPNYHYYTVVKKVEKTPSGNDVLRGDWTHLGETIALKYQQSEWLGISSDTYYFIPIRKIHEVEDGKENQIISSCEEEYINEDQKILSKNSSQTEVNYPTLDDIHEYHQYALNEHGGNTGIFPDGEGKIEAALGRAQSGFGDQEFYPSIIEKAAVIAHSIITTHPYQDANKRTAWLTLIHFLHYNGYTIDEDTEEIATEIISVASHEASYEHLLSILQRYTREMSDDEVKELLEDNERLSWAEYRLTPGRIDEVLQEIIIDSMGETVLYEKELTKAEVEALERHHPESQHTRSDDFACFMLIRRYVNLPFSQNWWWYDVVGVDPMRWDWVLIGLESGEKGVSAVVLSWQVQEDNFDRVVVDEDGTKIHYKGDEFHRLDGPAIEYADGSKYWYQNGKRHRIDGPATEFAGGSKFWYQNGKCHRIDGPAVENADGYKAWYQNGKYHRLDGPAIEKADGDKYWYINDKHYTEEEFNEAVKELNKTATPETYTTNSDVDQPVFNNGLTEFHQERFEQPKDEFIGEDQAVTKFINSPDSRNYKELDDPFGSSKTRTVATLDPIQDYDIAPFNEVKFGPSRKRELPDDVKYKKELSEPELWMEKRLHQNQEESQTERSITPFASQKLSWQLPIQKPEDLVGWLVKFNDSSFKSLIYGVVTSVVKRDNISDEYEVTAIWSRTEEEAVQHYQEPGAYYLSYWPDTLDKFTLIRKISEPFEKKSWQVQEDNFDRVKVDNRGTKRHYKGGELHRLDGPAIEWPDGAKAWFVKGQHHRLDGPALEYAGGYKEWWINDKQYTEEEFNEKVKELNKVSWQEIPSLQGWLVELKDTSPEHNGLSVYILVWRIDKYIKGWVGRRSPIQQNNWQVFTAEQQMQDAIDQFKGGKDMESYYLLKGYEIIPIRQVIDFSKIANNEYGVTDSQIFQPEDLSFATPVDDNRLQRTSPPRLDKRKDMLTLVDDEVSGKDYQTTPWKGASQKLSWQVQEDNFDRVKVDNRGTKRHYKGDKLHRLDGPAIEYANGSKFWYQNGKYHRLDGPAVERADGDKFWYQNGKHYTEEEFNKKIKELNKVGSTARYRIFFYIKPDDNLPIELEDEKELHVTLMYARNKIVDKERENIISSISEALKEFEIPEVSFNGHATFNNADESEVILINLENGASLYDKLLSILENYVEVDKDYDFIPHMTVGKGFDFTNLPNYSWKPDKIYLEFERDTPSITVDFKTGQLGEEENLDKTSSL